MPHYLITGTYLQNVSLQVEADDEDLALSFGMDAMVYGGEGIDTDGEWSEEFTAREID